MTDPREERMRMAKHLTSLVFEQVDNNGDWMFSEDHTVKIISHALRDWHKFVRDAGRAAQRDDDAHLRELEEAHVEMHRYNNEIGQTVCEFCEAIERAAANKGKK